LNFRATIRTMALISVRCIISRLSTAIDFPKVRIGDMHRSKTIKPIQALTFFNDLSSAVSLNDTTDKDTTL